jgi:hypothetical protein
MSTNNNILWYFLGLSKIHGLMKNWMKIWNDFHITTKLSLGFRGIPHTFSSFEIHHANIILVMSSTSAYYL